ncbi:MAG: efflux RND transporter periplasmic adaptor subunit [Myxococcota bacterium]
MKWLVLLGAATAFGAPQKVETFTVSNKGFEQKISLIGTIKAHREAILTAPAAGILTHIFAPEGTHVKKDQLLAEMESDGLRKSLTDTKSVVKAKRERLSRLKKLHDLGDISLKDLEDAKADLATAEHELEGSKFKAPFAGECGLYRAEVGSHLKSGDPVVAIYDISSLLAYFSVPENLLTKLKIGQKLNVKNQSATLTSFENRLNPKTQLAYAKASIAKCSDCIIGAKVPVELIFESTALSVPSESIFLKNGASNVYRVVGKKAVLTPVTVGDRAGKQTSIQKGLKAGDVVILRGQSRIQNDDPVY